MPLMYGVVGQSRGVGVAPCSQTAQAVREDHVCHVQGGRGPSGCRERRENMAFQESPEIIMKFHATFGL